VASISSKYGRRGVVVFISRVVFKWPVAGLIEGEVDAGCEGLAPFLADTNTDEKVREVEE